MRYWGIEVKKDQEWRVDEGVVVAGADEQEYLAQEGQAYLAS